MSIWSSTLGYHLKIRIGIILFCFVFFHTVYSQCPGLITRNTVKARSLGMGGAFSAIEDDIASLDFNPAAFSTDTRSDRIQVSFFFNPLGPVLVLNNWGKNKDWDVPISWILRGSALSFGRINVGLLLGEEVFSVDDDYRKAAFFEGSFFDHRRNTSLGFSLALSPLVSIGIVGEVFIREFESKKRMEFGYRYGVLIKTRSNLDVGLCFVDFPNDLKHERFELEGLEDETLNVGVSYTPWKRLKFSVDVRNVSDDEKRAVREPHLGLEITPITHLALRGGYYRERGGGREALSFGLGLFDWNSLLSENRRYSHSMFTLNSAYIWQWTDNQLDRWFILSSIIRF
jgi:hypothetical protein